MSSAVEDAIFEHLQAAAGGSVAPEGVARAVAGEGWRKVLPEVRATARRLARDGRLAILRHGRAVDPDDFKGVYRLGPPDG